MKSRRQIIQSLGALPMLALGSALATPSIARAADSARREFRIIRDGTDIGYHTVNLSRAGDQIEAAIEIEIKVKILGITAYRYEMTNRETWRAGRLIGIDSKVNDDGDDAFVRASLDGDRLVVDGSGYQGEAPADVATTSYWSHDFLSRPVWMSTQTGALLNVTQTAAGTGTVQTNAGPVATQKWAVGGDFEVMLHYDGKDWVGVEFDAGGEVASYTAGAAGPALQPVWSASV